MLEERQRDNLPASEWKSIHMILKPFAQYTTLISGADCTTLSAVVPIIHLHLEETKRVPDLDLSNAASALQSELRYQFRKYTDLNDPECEPVLF